MMPLSDHDQAKIREYLLGRLSEAEQEKIEERLMVEDDLFEELEILKGELIEEYREGELTRKDRESFEGGFLSSREGRERQAFAIAMGCLAQHHQPQPAGVLERLAIFFRKPQWAVATGALAVLMIAAIVWVRSPQQPSKFVAITLTSSAVTRSAGDTQYPRITIPPDASELRISLTLPQPATPGARYRVELDNRRNRTSIQPSGEDANSVSVVIPASQVPAGFYAVVVYEIKANGTEQQIPGNYFFITQ
jgi:hypothetical protein